MQKAHVQQTKETRDRLLHVAQQLFVKQKKQNGEGILYSEFRKYGIPVPSSCDTPAEDYEDILVEEDGEEDKEAAATSTSSAAFGIAIGDDGRSNDSKVAVEMGTAIGGDGPCNASKVAVGVAAAFGTAIGDGPSNNSKDSTVAVEMEDKGTAIGATPAGGTAIVGDSKTSKVAVAEASMAVAVAEVVDERASKRKPKPSMAPPVVLAATQSKAAAKPRIRPTDMTWMPGCKRKHQYK